MISSLNDFQKVFFIGIAGTGMSALAQYLQGLGKHISGSDRYFKDGEYNETKLKLQLGDIIKLDAPNNSEINDKIYFIQIEIKKSSVPDFGRVPYHLYVLEN